MKKKVCITLSIISFFLILFYMLWNFFGFLLLGGMFTTTMSKERIEEDFVKKNAEFITITNYIINSDNIYIIRGDRSTINSINNTEVKKAVRILFKDGYSSIIKSGNAISFERWSAIDVGGGVVYSIDGNNPELMFPTKLEPISEQNWYYYEEDFNEWRLLNP